MKFFLGAFLLLWIISGCAPKNSKPEATATKYTTLDEIPLAPVTQPRTSDIGSNETVLYATVITDSPNSAVSKLTAALKPVKGQSYEVEVRISSRGDDKK